MKDVTTNPPKRPLHRASEADAVSIGTATTNGPALDFTGLDTLWLQVTGTVCNIACRHCFITCGPKNDSHPIMTTDSLLSILDEARAYGVKEYYFTGGEPFLHPDIFLLIDRTLEQGPLSILTNGMLIDDAAAARLGASFRGNDYSLDLRVSLDGIDAAENDPIRGRGTYVSIMAGARCLLAAGVNPVFTVTTVHASYEDNAGRIRFLEELKHLGFARPRVKFIPPFHIGREARRSGAYADRAVLHSGDLFDGEEHVLMCGSSRTITAKGVYPCPILIEEEGCRMGGAWEEGLSPIRLNHRACVTCHVEGFSCRT